MDTVESKLKNSKVVVGLNQSKKLIKSNSAQVVYLANDADSFLANEITELCKKHGVELRRDYDMRQMGIICSIDVRCAVFSVEKNA